MPAGQGSAAGCPGRGGIHPVGLADEVAGHDAPDSVVLSHVVQAHGMRQGCLRVEVDKQNPIAVQRGSMGKVKRHGGLAGAALEVGDRCPEGALAGGSGRHQGLAVDLHLAAQRVDLVEAEPALTAVRFDFPAGKIRLCSQAAAEGGVVDPKDQLSNLPRGEAAEGLLVLGAEGLLADPALHLQRLGLQPREIFMRVHARLIGT